MKPRTFLQSLFKTFFSPGYYLEVLNTKIRFSVRFFLMSYVVLSLVGAALFFFLDVPYWERQAASSFVELSKYFPDALELQWDNQKLTSNQTAPIEVKYPSFLPHDTLPETFGYIDTAATSLDEIKQHVAKSSFFLVTQKQVFTQQSNTDWADTNLSDVPGFDAPFTLNKADLPTFISQWQKEVETTLHVATAAYPFGFFLFFVVVRLVQLYFYTLIAYAVLRIFQRPFPFWKIYQLGLHVAVVAEAINMATGRLFPQSDLPMFEIAFWIYLIVILLQLRDIRMVKLNVDVEKKEKKKKKV